jgi:hypothetical protein
MLGFYENFPKKPHRITHFSTSISNKKLQQTLIQIFHQLGNESLTIEDIANPSLPHCTVIFEFGIAEANNFNYLDNEEKNRILKAAQKKPFQTMDFLCSIRYYKIQNEKKTPLKFDYYILRFTFNKNTMEMEVFHERGPMHILPKEITTFIINKIDKKFSKKILKTPEAY